MQATRSTVHTKERIERTSRMATRKVSPPPRWSRLISKQVFVPSETSRVPLIAFRHNGESKTVAGAVCGRAICASRVSATSGYRRLSLFVLAGEAGWFEKCD